MLKRRIFAASLASVLALSSFSVSAFAADEKTTAYASKSDLSKLVEEMKTFDEEESDQYGSNAVVNFEKVLEYADAVANDDDASKDEIAVAYTMLQAAKDKLTPRTLNELASLVESCTKVYKTENINNEELDDEIYKETFWDDFESAYDAANDAVEDEEDDTATITDLYDELETAYDDLLENENKNVTKADFQKAMKDLTKALEKEYDYSSWERGTVKDTGSKYDKETYAWGTLFYHVASAFDGIKAQYDEMNNIKSMNKTYNSEICDAYDDCVLAAKLLNNFTVNKKSTYSNEKDVLKLINDKYEENIQDMFGWGVVATDIETIVAAESNAFNGITKTTASDIEGELKTLAGGKKSLDLEVKTGFYMCSYKEDPAKDEVKTIYKTGTVDANKYKSIADATTVQSAIKTAVTTTAQESDEAAECYNVPSTTLTEDLVEDILDGTVTAASGASFDKSPSDEDAAFAALKKVIDDAFNTEYSKYNFVFKSYATDDTYTVSIVDTDALDLFVNNYTDMKVEKDANSKWINGAGKQITVWDGTYENLTASNFKDGKGMGGSDKLTATYNGEGELTSAGVMDSNDRAATNVKLETIGGILFSGTTSTTADKYTGLASSDARKAAIAEIYDAGKSITFSADGKAPRNGEWNVLGQYLDVALQEYFEEADETVKLSELVKLKDKSYDAVDAVGESAVFAASVDEVVDYRKAAIALINDCNKNKVKEVASGSGSVYKNLKDALDKLDKTVAAFEISFDDVTKLIADVTESVDKGEASESMLASAKDLALKLALMEDIKPKSDSNDPLENLAILDGEYLGYNRVYTATGETKIRVYDDDGKVVDYEIAKSGADKPNRDHYNLYEAYKSLKSAYDALTSPTTTKGDVTENGTIDIDDAQAILKDYVANGLKSTYSVELGDFDGNGEVNLDDATAILKDYVSKM